MAVALYDREDDGGSVLSTAGSWVLQEARAAIRTLLDLAEEDEPVDLRDLQAVIHAAVDDVVLHEIIDRRLR